MDCGGCCGSLCNLDAVALLSLAIRSSGGLSCFALCISVFKLRRLLIYSGICIIVLTLTDSVRGNKNSNFSSKVSLGLRNGL